MSGVCNLQRGYTGNIQPYRADAHRTGEEAIIAALQSEGVPEKTAREMLGQGYGVKQVASRTGLPVATVTGLADTAGKTGAPSGQPDETPPAQQPDVTHLVAAVNARLRDLGISQLAASKMGKLS